MSLDDSCRPLGHVTSGVVWRVPRGSASLVVGSVWQLCEWGLHRIAVISAVCLFSHPTVNMKIHSPAKVFNSSDLARVK